MDYHSHQSHHHSHWHSHSHWWKRLILGFLGVTAFVLGWSYGHAETSPAPVPSMDELIGCSRAIDSKADAGEGHIGPDGLPRFSAELNGKPGVYVVHNNSIWFYKVDGKPEQVSIEGLRPTYLSGDTFTKEIASRLNERLLTVRGHYERLKNAALTSKDATAPSDAGHRDALKKCAEVPAFKMYAEASLALFDQKPAPARATQTEEPNKGSN